MLCYCLIEHFIHLCTLVLPFIRGTSTSFSRTACTCPYISQCTKSVRKCTGQVYQMQKEFKSCTFLFLGRFFLCSVGVIAELLAPELAFIGGDSPTSFCKPSTAMLGNPLDTLGCPGQPLWGTGGFMACPLWPLGCTFGAQAAP